MQTKARPTGSSLRPRRRPSASLGGLPRPQPFVERDHQGVVAASGTGSTGATTDATPRPRSAAAVPSSSSPGLDADAGGVARRQDQRGGRRAEAFELVDRHRPVGEAERREERGVGAEGPMGGQVDELGALERRAHGGHATPRRPAAPGRPGRSPASAATSRSPPGRSGPATSAVRRARGGADARPLRCHSSALGVTVTGRPREAGQRRPAHTVEGASGHDHHRAVGELERREQQVVEPRGGGSRRPAPRRRSARRPSPRRASGAARPAGSPDLVVDRPRWRRGRGAAPGRRRG